MRLGPTDEAGSNVKPATSLFIDATRFLAALVVFLHHLTSHDINAVFPWVSWGHEAVVLFFAISGFVIAYVVDTRERDVTLFVAARLGRLYSVVLPALLLTALVDHFGRSMSPQLYAGVPSDHVLPRLVINALFLQQNWNLTVAPLSNGPFWSLGYEFWYYAIFGSWMLLRGRARLWGALLCALCAGPRIVAFMPLWLAGVLAYKLGATWSPSRAGARTMFLVAGFCVVALLAFGNPLAEGRFGLLGSLQDRFLDLRVGRLFLGDMYRLPADLLLAAVFGLMLATAGAALDGVVFPDRMARTVRYLAGATFSLYLFHAPLLVFFVAWVKVDRHSAPGLLAVGAAVLVACLALSHLSERHVSRWRAFFLKLLERLRRRWGHRPLGTTAEG